MEMPVSKKTKDNSKCLSLLFSMFYISTFTFGGGFVIATFIKKRFVDELHWINDQEMMDMIALAQSSPGAIAVNVAILVGWRVAGFAGMCMSVLGTILPPMIILSALSFVYAAFATNPYVALMLKGMQAGVAAVVLNVVVSLGTPILKSRSIFSVAMMVAVFVAAYFLKINVALIVLLAACVGVVSAIVRLRKDKQL